MIVSSIIAFPILFLQARLPRLLLSGLLSIFSRCVLSCDCRLLNSARPVREMFCDMRLIAEGLWVMYEAIVSPLASCAEA